jgi:hypothetical protein
MSEALRAILRAKVTADGGYDEVGKRIGISGPGLHDLLSGKTASSFAVPALYRLYSIDPLEHLPIDEEQMEWLRLLEEIRAAGRDPKAVVRTIRELVLPSTQADPAPPLEPQLPEDKGPGGRPGRVRTRGTRE